MRGPRSNSKSGIIARLLFMSCLLLAFFVLPDENASASGFRFSPNPNKADQIHWREWTGETLREAQEKNMLILLSLSAIWCHWCHVMDETTYSDDGIIGFINDNYIPVRVDSDMRPDIDSLYNQGGWPSTVILLPTGDIIDGGNYIPPDEMKKMLSRSLLLFSRDRERLVSAIAAERARREGERLHREKGALDKSGLQEVLDLLKTSFDSRYGGFGSSQKFLNPEALEFILDEYVLGHDGSLKDILSVTLERMSRGEIHDRIEGGFFRYATRSDWSEPHYEKMLSLNARILYIYACYAHITGDRKYQSIARKTMDYIMNNLFDSRTGAFFGSQDADEKYYRLKDRKGAASPRIDRTMYTDSNADMISALVAYYAVTGERRYLKTAERAADFLVRKVWSERDGVHHFVSGKSASLPGILDDNVLLGSALLDLYSVTGKTEYKEKAIAIAGFTIDKFYSGSDRMFIASLQTSPVVPSIGGALLTSNTALTNYRAAIFLSRVDHLQKHERMRKTAEDTLAEFSGTFMAHTPSAPLYGTALRWVLHDSFELVLVSDGRRDADFLEQMSRVYYPVKVVKIFSLDEDEEEIRKAGYPLSTALYVCSGKLCSAPVREPGDVQREVARFIETLRSRR